MPIFIGILVLCAAFLVFGSKPEDASVLYYDPPGAEHTIPAGRVEDAEAAVVEQEPPVEDMPTEAPPAEDAAAIARGIYDGIDL